jgi:DMSO/TMAO reductase YedYZ molybdopterin-dependent catalytic subunit
MAQVYLFLALGRALTRWATAAYRAIHTHPYSSRHRQEDAMVTTGTRMPPGQRDIGRFPRFGTHLDRPPPAVAATPVVEVSLPGGEVLSLPVADLVGQHRQQQTADFHCVSGWSARDLEWEGIAFATFYREFVAPRLDGATVTHVLFAGLDGHESLLVLEDTLADDVLLADRLNGAPLGDDHGAPLRLVSPQQYGYMSCKHLCRIEVLTSRPSRELGAAHPVSRVGLRGPLVVRHPRARVWEEERHTFLPARLLRPLYRLVYRRAFRHGLGGEPPRKD